MHALRCSAQEIRDLRQECKQLKESFQRESEARLEWQRKASLYEEDLQKIQGQYRVLTLSLKAEKDKCQQWQEKAEAAKTACLELEKTVEKEQTRIDTLEMEKILLLEEKENLTGDLLEIRTVVFGQDLSRKKTTGNVLERLSFLSKLLVKDKPLDTSIQPLSLMTSNLDQQSRGVVGMLENFLKWISPDIRTFEGARDILLHIFKDPKPSKKSLVILLRDFQRTINPKVSIEAGILMLQERLSGSSGGPLAVSLDEEVTKIHIDAPNLKDAIALLQKRVFGEALKPKEGYTSLYRAMGSATKVLVPDGKALLPSLEEVNLFLGHPNQMQGLQELRRFLESPKPRISMYEGERNILFSAQSLLALATQRAGVPIENFQKMIEDYPSKKKKKCCPPSRSSGFCCWRIFSRNRQEESAYTMTEQGRSHPYA